MSSNQTAQHTVRFAGVPDVRLLETETGWQVQRRAYKSTLWFDVEHGHFSTREEALDAAPELCSF